VYKVMYVRRVVFFRRTPKIFGIPVGMTCADVAAELAVVIEETLHFPFFPSPEPFQLEDIVHRSEQERMIPEGVILDERGKGGLYVPEETDLIAHIREPIGLDLFAYLSPSIEAGFETDFDHLHFSTRSLFMGMESS